MECVFVQIGHRNGVDKNHKLKSAIDEIEP